MDQSSNYKNVKIEPFFNAIINAFKKLLFAIIRGVLSPVIAVLRKLARIIVNFIGEKVLKPIFRPIGHALAILVWPLKPLFSFIGKILDFIVSIVKFLANIVDMLVTLPFRILGGMGLMTFPDPPDPRYPGINDLPGVMKVGNIVGGINKNFTDSATNVHRVVNRNNFITFLTIIILAIIFITLYYFYDQFSDMIDVGINYIKSFLTKKQVD